MKANSQSVKKEHNSWLTGIIIFMALFTSLVFSDLSFDKVWTPKSLYFLLFVSCLGLIAFIGFFRSRQKTWTINFNAADLLLILYFGYALIRACFQVIPLSHNKDLHELTALLVFYLLLKKILSFDKGSFAITFSIVITGFIQIVWAISQWVGTADNLISGFGFAGGLANPNILSAYLGIILLFACHVILDNPYKGNSFSRLLTFLSWIIAAVGLILIIYIQSRAVWIGLAAGLFFYTTKKYRLARYIAGFGRKILLVTVVVILTGFVAYFLFTLKKDSATGRFFIWTNTVEMIKDYPVFGTGYGSFGSVYNHYQAKHFQTMGESSPYFYLADNIEVAYNEYLHVLSETGVVGFLLFFAFLVLLFGIGKAKSPTFLPALSALVVLLVISIFTYTFQILPLYILFIICAAVVSAHADSRNVVVKNVSAVKSFFTILILSTLVAIYQLSQNMQMERKLKNISVLMERKDFITALRRSAELNDQFRYNKYFIFLHGKLLFLNKEYNTAIEFLEQSRPVYCEHFLYLSLGDCYYMAGNLDKAIKNYQYASNIIPHLITPRFLVVKSYEKTGELRKAVYLAKKAIQMDTKVPSKKIELIKRQLAEIVRKYNSDGKVEN